MPSYPPGISGYSIGLTLVYLTQLSQVSHAAEPWANIGELNH
ncbi:MAG: hypothetical protein R6U67_18905 [Sodalinema sp.]